MNLEEIQAIDHYDSTISTNSTLLVSSKNGLLSIFYASHSDKSKDRISCDFQSKKVNFFSGDDYLFTSTDDEGLKVWDREKQMIIYTYPEDILLDHTYLQNRTIAALSEIGIKFYDLRMRYASTFYPRKNIEKIYSKENQFTFCTDTQVYKYENNKSIIIHSSDERIIDYTHNTVLKKDTLYFLDLEIEKPHIATKIVPVHDRFREMDILVSTINGNKLNIIEKKKDHEFILSDCQIVDNITSDTDNLYVFADKKFFINKPK